MFKIQRFADCGGIKKQWLHRSASGTIAYMCPKCYNILYANGKYDFNIKTNIDFYVDMVFGYNCPNCENNIQAIELDPNIADDISILNKKGYKTKYCCEGHISDHQYISAPYIYFNNTHDDIAKNLPKTWYVDNDGYNGFVIRADINNSKKKILEDLHKMVEKLPEVDKPKKRSHIYIEYDDVY